MKPPKRAMTEASTRRAAFAYVERWSTSRAHLRRLVGRRIEASVEHFEGEPEPLYAALDAALDDLERLGLLDDARFAESKARAGVRRGVAPGRVAERLAAKGISRDVARAAVAAVDVADPAFAAACAYVRKRRLGAYRGEGRGEARADDLAKLARAGFGYDVARRALDLDTPAEVEAELAR